MSTIAKENVSVIDLHHTAPTEFIEAEGNIYAYRIMGNHKGIPLLLLQHFTGTMDNWDPAVTNGLAEYFKVILFDNRGIGASSGDAPDNIQAMANDTRSFIKALRIQKINILGFSMGGFIAQQVTLDEPSIVHKLILAGTAHKGAENVAEIVKRLEETSHMAADEQKLYLFYSSTLSSRALGMDSLSRINRRTINRDPDTILASVQSQLKAILGWATRDKNSTKRLVSITQPILVVNGNNDIVVPTDNSYIMQQHLPAAQLILYPDSGHGSIFQYPGLFLREAVSFLQDEE